MKTNTTIRSAAAAALLFVALVLATSASGGSRAVPVGNLVVNGNAEDGPGATGDRLNTVVSPPGWTTSGPFTVIAYDGGPDANGDFPLPDFATKIGGGKNFFAGGNSSEDTSASQTIDLSSAAAEIDAGNVKAGLSAYLGANWTQPNYMTLDAQLLDGSGAQIADMHLDGPTNTSDADLLDSPLVPLSTAVTLPKGTRSARIVLTSHDVDGGWNSGYADNVSFRLTGPQPPSPKPKAKPALSVHCSSTKVTATVTAAGVSSVAFSVGKLHSTDRRAPFSAAFPKHGLARHASVTARVTLTAGGSLALSKKAPC